jgi:hypothetical protein
MVPDTRSGALTIRVASFVISSEIVRRRERMIRAGLTGSMAISLPMVGSPARRGFRNRNRRNRLKSG